MFCPAQPTADDLEGGREALSSTDSSSLGCHPLHGVGHDNASCSLQDSKSDGPFRTTWTLTSLLSTFSSASSSSLSILPHRLIPFDHSFLSLIVTPRPSCFTALAFEILVSRGIASIHDYELRMIYPGDYHLPLNHASFTAAIAYKSSRSKRSAPPTQEDRERRLDLHLQHPAVDERDKSDSSDARPDLCDIARYQTRSLRTSECDAQPHPSQGNDEILNAPDSKCGSGGKVSQQTRRPVESNVSVLNLPQTPSVELGRSSSVPTHNVDQSPRSDVSSKPANTLSRNVPHPAPCFDEALYPSSGGSKKDPLSMTYNMDGTFDEVDESQLTSAGQFSSASDLMVPCQQSLRHSMVRFLSDEQLNWREAVRKVGIDDFTNPFSPGDSPSTRTSSASEGTTYYRPNAFAGHRDTLARLGNLSRIDSDAVTVADSDGESYTTAWTRQLSTSVHPRSEANPNIHLPQQVINTILDYVSPDGYKTMRLVCRHWFRTLPQPHLPGFYRLPREIIKLVFSYLAPSDFDPARHTCKSWYLASLDCKVLEPMILAFGCRAGVSADLDRLQSNIAAKRRSWDDQLGPVASGLDDIIDEEWLYSKRLATECLLSPSWAGSSLSDDNALPRLALIEAIDFSKILSSLPSATKPTFTVSACGKFVLVVSGSDVSVFTLSDPHHSIAPVVRLATGIDVLKVSMDTSSERYSVAALLAGRLGMLWDLSGHHIQERYRSHSGDPMSLGMQTSISSSATCQYFRPFGVSLPMRAPEAIIVETHDYLGPRTPVGGNSSPFVVTGAPFL